MMRYIFSFIEQVSDVPRLISPKIHATCRTNKPKTLLKVSVNISDSHKTHVNGGTARTHTHSPSSYTPLTSCMHTRPTPTHHLFACVCTPLYVLALAPTTPIPPSCCAQCTLARPPWPLDQNQNYMHASMHTHADSESTCACALTVTGSHHAHHAPLAHSRPSTLAFTCTQAHVHMPTVTPPGSVLATIQRRETSASPHLLLHLDTQFGCVLSGTRFLVKPCRR